MQDPRFNSMHLTRDRREEYRLARDRLLHCCGEQTIWSEKSPGAEDRSSMTMIDKKQAPRGSENLTCWLSDSNHFYPLKIGLNTVGRSSENDVVIRDGYVSRRHCTILVHSDYRCELHDTASKNGTFINGSKMHRPIRIRPGDQIRMCDCTLTFMTNSPISDSHAGTCTLS